MNKIDLVRKRFQEGKLTKITLHLLAWFILVGLPLYIIRRYQVGTGFIWLYYLNTLINGIIFYINYLVLVPRLYFRNKKVNYLLSVIGLLVFFYFVSDISNNLAFQRDSGRPDNEQMRTPPPDRDGRPMPPPAGRILSRPPFRGMHMYSYGLSSAFLIFFSLGLRVLERQGQIEKLQKEMEKEKLNSELALLKNQISPHFFFNTLNNIYSLISVNAEDSQKAVLKLSKLMRYLLYESDHGNTLLSSEIEFMKNYIDLMKLRMSDKVDLKVAFPSEFEDRYLPPLLFIPFIENAFKHGISYREMSFIEIALEADQKKISFICLNSIPKRQENDSSSHQGIGLENVKKRLSLLYPDSHELIIDRSEKVFKVLLTLNQ